MSTTEAMVAVGLVRLEGQGTVERWGFEDLACGEKRSLQHWLEKKQEKKHNFTCVPVNASYGSRGTWEA